MTGRAAGYCGGYDQPGFSNPIPGRGFWGRGGSRGWSARGRGWRNRYWATGLPGWMRGHPWDYRMLDPSEFSSFPAMSLEQEKVTLEQQVHFLEQQLKETKKRLAKLEKGKAK